jgi:hypothetical protein
VTSTIAALVAQLAGDDAPDWVAAAALALTITAVAIAGAHTVPAARRLGTGQDAVVVRSRLARSILRDHLGCLGAIALVLVLQLGWAR